MTEKTFTIKSSDEIELFCYKWLPSDKIKPKAILQLVHGSLEHTYRYIHFIKKLTEEGYIVYGCDQRGHGKTAEKIDLYSYFSDNKHGWNYAVNDLKIVYDLIKSEHPKLAVFIYGHSMGSFLTRDFIHNRKHEIKGVILSGTGVGKPFLQKCVISIAALTKLFRGRRYKSKFLTYCVYGILDKMVKEHKTKSDFMTRDLEELDKFHKDPMSGNTCTAEFVYEMLKGITKVNTKKELKRFNSNLPLFILAGEKDPVGDTNGKGVIKLKKEYKKSGVMNTELIIYPDDRHEVLNEFNKEEVMKDFINWMDKQI